VKWWGCFGCGGDEMAVGGFDWSVGGDGVVDCGD